MFEAAGDDGLQPRRIPQARVAAVLVSRRPQCIKYCSMKRSDDIVMVDVTPACVMSAAIARSAAASFFVWLIFGL